MKKKYLTYNPFQTKKLGEAIAKKILKSKIKKNAFIVRLEGDLGGGKTTFLKGFAKGLGIKQRITSPTFVILRKFKVKDLRFMYFYHIDCYRIKKPKEILDLGFGEIIKSPKNIIVIEWAERIRKILPKNTIILEFKFINKKIREIILK